MISLFLVHLETSNTKKNKSLIPENQIITANPEIIIHDIAEEDEFLVIVCDGKSHIVVPS